MHFPNFNLTNKMAKMKKTIGNIMTSINYNLPFSFNITYKKYFCSSSPIANPPVVQWRTTISFSFNNIDKQT